MAITLVSIYAREIRSYVHTKPCAEVFIIAALFVTAKNWKPRCSLMGEWSKYGTSIPQNSVSHQQKEH